MLIATSLAAAWLLSAPALASKPLPSTPPALSITVAAAPTLSRSLLTRVLNEAGELWHAAGFILIWDVQPAAAVSDAVLFMGVPSVRGDRRSVEPASRLPGALSASSVPVDRAPAPGRLLVTIGDEPGIRRGSDPNVVPLGWIVFEAGSPTQQIYLSHSNTAALLNTSEGVVGRLATMTVMERETLLGRAMGRALAHEVGHYLLSSKVHTASGMMQARRGAAELFSASRHGFRLAADQRRVIAARLNVRWVGLVGLVGGEVWYVGRWGGLVGG